MRWLALFVSAMALAGCGSGDPAADEESATIEGLWLIDSYEVDGVRSQVEVDVNASKHPWIEVSGEHFTGSAGCNQVGGDYTFSDGVLVTGEWTMTLMACIGLDGTELMGTEEAFVNALGHGGLGIGVEVADTEMTWSSGNTRLMFVRVEAVPEIPPPPPRTVIGWLNCSPGIVVENRVGDIGIDPAQMLTDAEPAVVRIEPDPPSWWWGYDAGGRVVGAVAEGDIVPVEYQVFTCSG